MDWMIPKKTYLCPWDRGCLPDYVLQSTPVSNKTQNLDKSQPFSVIISIIESTKIRKIQAFLPFLEDTDKKIIKTTESSYELRIRYIIDRFRSIGRLVDTE